MYCEEVTDGIMVKVTGIQKSQRALMVSYVAMGLQDNVSASGWWNGYNSGKAAEKSKAVVCRRIETLSEDPISGIRFL